MRKLKLHHYLWLLGLSVSVALVGARVLTSVIPIGEDLSPTRRPLQTLAWSELDPMPPVAGSTSVVVGDRVVIAGGEDASRNSVTRVSVLSNGGGPHTEPVALHHARAFAAAAGLGTSHVLIVGGLALALAEESEDATAGRTAELIDVDGATSTVSELPWAPHSGHTATAIDARRVLVAGGEDNHGSTAIFEADTGTWRATAPLPQPRRGHTATLLDDGRVVVMGGVDHVTNDLATDVVAYDVGADAWHVLPSMNTPRSGHTVTRLRDGRLLVVAGRDAAGARLPSVELFEPVSATWSAASPLQVARSHHGAALLPDGRVAVVAGVDENMREITATEVYDPVSNTWAPGPELPSPRFDATYIATDEALFLIGGFGPGGLADLRGTVFRLSD